jgi:long-chain acyl-CoA synthetase
MHPWLSSYPSTVDWHTPLAPKPLFALLEDSARDYGHRPCLHFLGTTLTYQEVWQKTLKLAGHLQKAGIGKGSRVALLMPNHPLFVISFFAILRTGATVVNMNPLSADTEVHQQLKDAEVSLILTVNLGLCVQKLKTLSIPIWVGDFAGALPLVTRTLFRLLKAKDIAQTDYPSLESKLSGTDAEPVTIHPTQDIALLQYTGGTTGTPKAAMLTHANLYSNALQCSAWCASVLPMGKEKMLGVLPLFHVFAMTAVMNLGLHRAMEIILLPRFDIKQLLRTIHRRKPTVMQGVPTLYAAVANHPQVKQYNLRSIKCCISGGAPLPLDVKKRFEALTGCTLVEGYGLTESSPVSHVNPLSGDQKEGTIGLPLPGTEVSIRNVENPAEEMPYGERGEICLRGPQVMQGYWHREEETAKVLVGGWLRTGDMGMMDEQGYVTVVDRIKELIITRGYNVYPRMVEEALYQHPAIAEAAVIGVEDAVMGQKVKAVVACKSGQSVDEEALREFLKDKVAAYALPKIIEFRDSLPKTMVGKILKKAL